MHRQRWRAVGASLLVTTAAASAAVIAAPGLAGADPAGSSLGVLNVPHGDILDEGYYRMPTVTATGTAASVLVTMADANGHSFTVDIAPKTGGSLNTGLAETGTAGTASAAAARLVVAETLPAAKSCDAPVGEFKIDDLAFGGGTVTKLAMTWKLRCTSLDGQPMSSGYVYFAEPDGPLNASAVGEFYPMSPNRVLDTRNGAPLGPGGTVDVQVSGGSSGVPVGALAVVLNVTAVGPDQSTFLTVFPAGEARPMASNVNPVATDTVPNLATVKVGAGGKVTLYNEVGTTNAVLDVTGYYLPDDNGTAGLRFVGQTPARLLDTRDSNGPLGPGVTHRLTVTADNTAQAAVLNVTATAPTTDSYLTVFPAGESLPLASNLNFRPGQTIPNLVVVKLVDGKADIYNAQGNTQVVVDLVGLYKTAGAADTPGRFVPITPTRAYDSRNPSLPGMVAGPLAQGEKRDLGLVGLVGNYPFEFSGLVGNVTVADTTTDGFLTVYPTGSGIPLASNLNWMPTEIRANLVATGTDAYGFNSFFNEKGTANLVVDVAGWFTR